MESDQQQGCPRSAADPRDNKANQKLWPLSCITGAEHTRVTSQGITLPEDSSSKFQVPHPPNGYVSHTVTESSRCKSGTVCVRNVQNRQVCRGSKKQTSDCLGLEKGKMTANGHRVPFLSSPMYCRDGHPTLQTHCQPLRHTLKC